MSTSADSHQWLRRGQSSTWLLFQYHTQTYSIHNADRSSQYHIRSHWNRLYIDTINCPRHILGRDKVFVIYTLSWVDRNEVFVIYYLQIMTWQKWALFLLNILLSWCIEAKQCLSNGITCLFYNLFELIIHNLQLASLLHNRYASIYHSEKNSFSIHWGMNKMNNSLLMTISNAFSWMNLGILFQILLNFVSRCPIYNKSALVQVMACHVTLNKWQAITWINDDTVHWHHMGSLSHRVMMTSSNGNIFPVTGHLCREFTDPRWIPHTKASDAKLGCFLWSASE